MRTWPLAVWSDRPLRLLPGFRIDFVVYTRATRLSGKAPVETAGSCLLVVSAHSSRLPVPLYVLTHARSRGWLATPGSYTLSQ